jgi:TonB family protein
MKLTFTAIVLFAAAFAAKAQDTGGCSNKPVPPDFAPFCRVLETSRNSSLAHYRIAELLFLQNNYQSSANEFREVLNGDLDPKWTGVWAHINLGTIFEVTNQRDRAVNEYRQARRTGDDTFGAQEEAIRLSKELGADLPPFTRIFDRRAVAEPVTTVPPDYTDEARTAKLEGTVLLEGTIGGDGAAHDLTVLRPLGLGLDEKAIDAVRQWLFVPNQANGQSISMRNLIAVDFFLSSNLSRWHLVGVTFDPPTGSTRPEFLSTVYPPGAGIVLRPEIIDRGSILVAIGRPATATLGFDIDEQGRPANIRVQGESDTMWGSQAVALVSAWRFKPGMKDSRQVSVPCSIDLMWGPRNITSVVVDRFRGAYAGQ